MNPILPPFRYLCDVEARVWEDGRVYVYGTCDTPGDTQYGSHIYRAYSSADLVNWSDHGIILSSSEIHASTDRRLFAPDCIENNGLYYLFYCTDDKREGVARSSSPSGPFEQATGVQGADGDGIDPAVLIDDDGAAYYYWGQFDLKGARMLPELNSIDESTVETLLTESVLGFHEGASIRKRNGVYYLTYTDISRDRATCLSYATSRSPLGPYEKQGTIIDNSGCDPGTWNNHGSIQEVHGTWYVFYHRSSQASRYNRRLCIEPIHFDDNGMIAEVEMTTQGPGQPIPAKQRLPAFRACKLSGSVRANTAWASGKTIDALTHIESSDSAAYKYIDFADAGNSVSVVASSATQGGFVDFRVDEPDGRVIATCEVKATGSWSTWQDFEGGVTEKIEGIRALHLSFRGGRGRLMDLASFQFFEGSPARSGSA
ncbi:MAG: family 43 glycosylhydrolase [Rhodothermales bacterium]|nr:family 43 glycosylhydrolase [Rhodothermales bacterium]